MEAELRVDVLDTDPGEGSPGYPFFEVVCEYTDVMLGSGEIPVVGSTKGL
jgi:hypothetical protein